MTSSVQLFDKTPISSGLNRDLGNYRLNSICDLSPHEIRDSAKSRIPEGAQRIPGIVDQVFVGRAPRAHQKADFAAMVGNKLPTLRAAKTL